MSVIQGTGTSIYLAAHMKEQARSMSIDPRKEDEKDCQRRTKIAPNAGEKVHHLA